MLSLLRTYLLRYRTVTLPGVGTIELHYTEPSYDVVNHLITPPQYQFQVNDEKALEQHQLDYLSRASGKGEAEVRTGLNNLSQRLKTRLTQGEKMTLTGIDDWRLESGQVRIRLSQNQLLKPITAIKVQREDAMHAVQIGDREVQSSHIISEQETHSVTTAFRGPRFWISLALLIILLLAVVFVLYRNNFSVTATGLDDQLFSR